MLQNYPQFVTTQAVKNQTALISPRVIKTVDVSIPRESVYHYLDTSATDIFPTREMPYIANVPKNKKVPLMIVRDLLYKKETTTIADRTLDKTVRDWGKNNIAKFHVRDLLEQPNTDVQTNAVVDYNALTDLYKYSATSTSKLSHRENLYKTYWETVKKMIQVSPTAHQFVSITIPNNIPTAQYLLNLNKFEPTVLSRVIVNDALYNVWSLFNFLNPGNRNKSAMSVLSDEDTQHIVMELKYGGYSCFFKLSDMLSLSSGSKLLSKRKIDPWQVQKFLVVILFNIQKTVTNLTEGVEETPETETSDLSLAQQAEQDEDVEADNDNFNLDDRPSVSAVLPTLKKVAETTQQSELPEELTNTELVNFIDSKMDGLTDLDSMELPDEIYAEPTTPDSEDADDSSIIPVPDYSEETKAKLLTDKPSSVKFESFLTKAKNAQILSSVEIRNLRKIKEKRDVLPSPYNPKEKLDEGATLLPEDSRLEEDKLIVHRSMPVIKDSLKKEVLFNFDKQYLQKAYKKDVLSCVRNIENAGVVIKDYTVDVNRSSLGAYEIHKLTLKPYHGKESQVYFRLPVVNSEGEYTASGVKYKMKRSRQDLPIRKVSPIRVALTSNYTKLFVSRSERVTYDPYNYISKFIKSNYLDEEGLVKTIDPGYSFDNTEQRPNIFASLSRELRGFTTENYTFQFNARDFDKHVKPEVLEDIKGKKDYPQLTYVGFINKDKHILVVDQTNTFYDYSNNMTPIGTMQELLSIDPAKLPKPFTNVKVLGDDIPIGLVLGYYLGLTNLLAVTETQYTTLPTNKQYQSRKDELVLKFDDHKLILKTDTESKRLIFNGFIYYKDFLKTIPVNSLLTQEIYLDMVQFRGYGLMHLKELDMLKDMFVDPITLDVLKSMGMPTSFLELLLKANSMLDDFSHPDINDPTYSRIRGFDRIPGLMYRALTESVRASKFRGNGRGKIELDPYKVWNYVTQDNTVKITEDANPISDVKEVEAVTFSGLDGISKTATPEAIRRFHKKDRGLVSEATVDSSDVGLNFYLSPYAKLKDLRGTVDSTPFSNDAREKLFSSSVLLTPFAEHDDPKRQNFISIQNGHTIVASGYQQPIIRTGHEYLMPYKVGKLYCVIAQEDGVVQQLVEKKLVVQYKSGKVESFSLGDTYGRMEGSVYKHQIVSDLKAGDKFKQEDHLTYNNGYFEKDWLNPSRLIMKFSKLASVAFMMNDEVYEDSSAVSAKLSEEMKTPYVKEKIFLIEFNKNIIGLKEEGALIEPNDVLFTLVDGSTDYSNLSDSSIDLLKTVSALSPKAKMKGKIFKYEIKYNGDVTDMSPSLKKFVTSIDKDINDRTKDSEEPVTNNSVTSEYRSEGKNLLPSTLELRVFIESSVSLAVGDKGVIGAQMKSVVSDVFQSDVTTESGLPVDVMFSYRSVLNRTVLSPILMGTTSRLLVYLSPKIADVYFS